MNKKVLVTGACGFIGSHLTELLVQKGFKVKAMVHYNSIGTRGWLENTQIGEEIEFINGDISDFDFVNKSIKDCGAVFHLAALIGIPYSYISPKAYIRTNIEGTYNILESCKSHDIENVLITSTSETYGSAQYTPIDEKHPLVGQSPYSASKIAADQLAISYHRSFKLPVKIVRPFNTYGPRQSARAIIPTIFTQLISNENKISLGNLEPKRDFTYVKDTVNGFLEIYNSKTIYGEVTNIGANESISMKDLLYKIYKIAGKEIPFELSNSRVRPERSEVNHLLCDNSKIKSNTNWKQKTNLDDGLTKTYNWLKNNIDLYRSDIYNV